MLAALKDTSASSIALSIQPIGKSWLEAARGAGGDAIDLDPNNGDLIGMERAYIVRPMRQATNTCISHESVCRMVR